MAKYNIYKIKDSKSNELKTHLVSDREFRLVNSFTSDDFSFNVYFKGPEDANMWWLEQYGSDFFGESMNESNKIYSGAIIATKESNSFIIPFGKTHFYIQDFIVYNFGLDVAEKIANQHQAKMKSFKRFGGKTSKSLVSFSFGSSIDFSSGDSAEYLKLKAENTDDWGTSFIHFGTSIQFSSIEIEPNELPILLNKLISSENSSKKFSIPLMLPIKDDQQKIALYKELGSKISSRDSDIAFVDFEIYGTDFVFSQQTHVQLKYKSTESDMFSELDTSDIASFAEKNNINLDTEITHIKVKILIDGQSKYTTQLINLIEYHSNTNHTFLYRGKWFKFNNSFITQLHQSLENIKPTRFQDSFSESEFIAWKDARADSVNYRERFVIEKIHETHGYEVYDREMEYIPYGKNKYQIEVGDVYDAENSNMYVIKIGSPRDFGYAFDQAMVVLHNIQGGIFKVNNYTELSIKTITLLLLFKTDRTLDDVTETNSLIFELKLDDLKKLANEKGVSLNVQYSNIL